MTIKRLINIHNIKRILFVQFMILITTITACSNNGHVTDRQTPSTVEATSTDTGRDAETTTHTEEPSTNQETTTADEVKGAADGRIKYTKADYKKLINFDAEFPFAIKINRARNFTTIYGLDKNGRYSIPYKIFLCSTGREVDYTPLGMFYLGQKYDWRLMVDNTYAQYAIRIEGQIMLHSVPYYSPNKNDLEVEEYAKLGEPASLGCIRYNVANIKWIYDNCPDGTRVYIYDDEDEKPALKLPKKKKAVSTGKFAGWDPTDPDPSNPYGK